MGKERTNKKQKLLDCLEIIRKDIEVCISDKKLSQDLRLLLATQTMTNLGFVIGTISILLQDEKPTSRLP